MIELLAPAGNMECLKAAILNGADAIYMGLEEFNARNRADNFTKNNFLEAVNFCHVRGKKIYLALNILIHTNEMKKALDMALFAYNNGVDAVIIQDLGLAYNIKKYIPNLKLHASTQCSAIDKNGVENLKKLGFERIVVGREVTITKLNEICTLNAEIEVFIHGALCVSISGQCLMSSLNGGRSGNRGLCAQPCRVEYDVFSGNEHMGSKYILSPKDVCTIERIDEVIKSGVTSLKIEGRMKSPQYVAQVVSSYKKAIDGHYEKNEYDKLLQVFNREGFFSSYLFEQPSKDVFAYNNPTNTGLKIGKVIEINESRDSITIETNKDIESGDGITFGFSDVGMYVRMINKQDGHITIIASGIFPKEDSDVYLTYDKSLDKKLLLSFRNEYKIKVNLNIRAYFKKGELPILEYNNIKIVGNMVCEQANSNMKERIITQILKTGNTIFDITIDNDQIDPYVYYPIAQINNMRRMLLEKVYESRKASVTNHNIDFEDLEYRIAGYKKEISVFFYKYREDIKLSELDVDIIYLPIESKGKTKDKRVIYWIEENNTKHDNSLVSNIGLLNETTYLDYGANIYNPWTILAYEKISDIKTVTASVELNSVQLNILLNHSNKKIECVVFGKLIAMKSKYCINGALFNKPLCSTRNLTIKNKANKEYDVLKYCNTCTSYIIDGDFINIIDYEISPDIYRINIHNESKEQVLQVIEHIKKVI